ncbi:MAG TPA: peptidoglycan-binding domain-containing protein [Kofleriaceae bacterium]|nr:peptidoglycan-binding domain-containing protein [Kofleriaceae bacterium]
MRLVLAIVLGLLPAAGDDDAHADDCEAIAVWRDGKRDGSVCRADAAARGLAVLDLRDDWVPSILAAAPDGTGPEYRTTYLALAQERFADAGVDGALAARDRYLELFGIVPSLGVMRARLGDDARHRCHEAIDDAALAAAPGRIAEELPQIAAARLARARTLRAALEHDRARRKLPDLAALAAAGAYYRRALELLAILEAHPAAVRTVQGHLACDGLFDAPPLEAAYTWQTSLAVQRFQRGALILPTGILDAETREAIALGSRERDVRTALRVLRERVVAATGLLEDGTASAGPGTVLGRALEPAGTWRARGHAPLADAAPDLVSATTEAAARALGWRDAASVRASLDRLAAAEGTSRVVAVALPALPAYHGPAMQLSVDIDRGGASRRPALIVYTVSSDRRIPLARWPTTVGGWQLEQSNGLAMRWKESPAGPRIWRDLYVGPSWLPPSTTPDRELVRTDGGRYVLARELLGPSYRAAFGLVAFVHLVEEHTRGGVVTWDQGIRTHGTGNLASIANGASHGCHRLLGLHVVRLAGFVIAHREHVQHGDTRTYYRSVVRHGGSFPVAIDSLGYRIELVSPIPVEVLHGPAQR